MLQLKDIVKEYPTGDSVVTALKGVSVSFRDSEFVSILGHSGCGKTTLLNIIGGLDHYTSGDLIIEGVSTKDYKDRDWDNYRNHKVGFVFQSYNLIPHQTVLQNVELALTLSGVSKAERRQRAKEALEQVGLGDQLNKKPNQLSGGQMQRVAIARALVNNPEILLADEPTGALDSETSVQIMEILREVAKTRLIVMVTHNPELAEEYSTRIIRLVDGNITDDTNPFDGTEEEAEAAEENTEAPAEKQAVKKDKKKAEKKPSMSFFTALSLSTNNLLTKKMRTFMTSFAGSIGIIGIALILSLSNGFQLYIDSIQRETLTSYPITIDRTTTDSSSALTMMANMSPGSTEVDHELDKVYSNTAMSKMMNSFSSAIHINDLEAFKKFIESGESNIDQYVSSIQYKYDGQMNIYAPITEDKGINQVYPSPIIEMMNMYMSSMGGLTSMVDSSTMESYAEMYNSWMELVDNEELIKSQYDLIYGNWMDFSNPNQVVLIVDKNNEISSLAVLGLGLANRDDMMEAMMSMMSGGTIDEKPIEIEYSDVVGMKFKLITNPEYYQYDEETQQYVDMSEDEEYVTNLINNAEEIEIVGIIRPAEGTAMVSTMGGIGYTSALTEYVVKKTNDSELVKKQMADPTTDVFTGLPFPVDEEEAKEKTETKAETKTEETTKTTNTDVFVTPKVTSLDFNGETPKTSYTADMMTMPDINSLPAVTEEEIYAKIDASTLSAEEKAEAKRLIELMAKDNLSLSERTELQNMLGDMMSESGIPISGTVAYSYLSNYSKEDKLKLIGYFMDQNPAMAGNEAPAEESGEEPAEGEDGEEPETGAETAAEAEAEQEEEIIEEEVPQPLAASYDEALELLGVGDLSKPKQINIYPKDFESKDEISKIIDAYNAKNDEGEGDNYDDHRDKDIVYTDYIGILLKSVTKIINIISYVLIAFVAISLVVSSIMIGIITYISVLERTKEIGILRAIGASKKDISRVFNAETLIVGFVSGVIGIGVTILLTIPINILIKYLTSIPNVAQLPTAGAIALIIISMVLTFIAGLIPSGVASRKDPVIALRTE